MNATAIKASWIGQTYALAKRSDPGGKKSRTRLSKEERKAMAESFIKKYQELNSGSFPSLNLAHKEVGGSFYTMREIVREIIQENRVLGPPKLTGDEQKTDHLVESYPLGSISTEPQLNTSKESHLVFTENQSTYEEVVNTSSCEKQQQTVDGSLYTNGILANEESKEADASKLSAQGNDEMPHTSVQISKKTELMEYIATESTSKETPIAPDVTVASSTEKQQQTVDGSLYINGILANEESKEADASKFSAHENGEMLHTTVQISQKTELTEYVVTETTSKVTPIATDVTVETFSMPSSPKVSQKINERSTDVEGLAGNVEELEIKNVEVASEPVETSSVLDGGDSLENHSSGPLDEISDGNQADPSFLPTTESNESSTLHIQVEDSCNDDFPLLTTDQNQVVAVAEPKPAPNNVHTKNSVKNASQVESLSQKESVTETKADNRIVSSTDEGRNSTLNRTKLESWEGASKKPSEANPVWGVFQAFITAFVKFWTE